MTKEKEKAREKEFLTIKEVAERLRISRPTVRGMIRDGKFSAVKAGRRVFRILAKEVDDFISAEQEDRR